MERAAINTGTETGLEHGSGVGLWLVNRTVTYCGGSSRLPANETGTTAVVRVPAITDEQAVDEVGRGPTVLFRELSNERNEHPRLRRGSLAANGVSGEEFFAHVFQGAFPQRPTAARKGDAEKGG